MIIWLISFPLTLLPALMGIMFINNGVNYWVTFKSTARWTQVPAVIQHLELIPRSGRTGTHYKVKTEYSYHYSGINYNSKRFDIFPSNWVNNNNPLLVKQVKRSDDIYCFVNPDNPGEAVLIRNLQPDVIGFTALGLLFFIISVYFAISTSSIIFCSKETLDRLKKDYSPRGWFFLFLSVSSVITLLNSFLLHNILGCEIALYFNLAAIFAVLVTCIFLSLKRFRKRRAKKGTERANV